MNMEQDVEALRLAMEYRRQAEDHCLLREAKLWQAAIDGLMSRFEPEGVVETTTEYSFPAGSRIGEAVGKTVRILPKETEFSSIGTSTEAVGVRVGDIYRGDSDYILVVGWGGVCPDAWTCQVYRRSERDFPADGLEWQGRTAFSDGYLLGLLRVARLKA